jgi:hypothetical protein
MADRNERAWGLLRRLRHGPVRSPEQLRALIDATLDESYVHAACGTDCRDDESLTCGDERRLVKEKMRAKGVDYWDCESRGKP